MTTLPPFVRTSETSRLAAISVYRYSTTARAKVYRFIHERGMEGATDDEMQRALAMAAHTQCPRRIDLMREGTIEPHGERRTAAGRKAVVWVATEVAREVQQPRLL